MLKTTVELLMSEYFLTQAVLGKNLESSEKLFHALGKILLFPEAEMDGLYHLAENDVAKGITNEGEFRRYQRMQKYSEIVGLKNETNPEWEEVAIIKGNAMLLAQNFRIASNPETTKTATYNAISSASNRGIVVALRVMGILQCEGIFFAKNEKAGLKNLRKASDWNDIVSTLALLHCVGDARPYNMARLRMEVANTPFEELYSLACEIYGKSEMEIEEVKLLNKAFNAGALKREVFDPKYSRILNCKTLSINDKERSLFSQNRELITMISNLPLKLDSDNVSAVDVTAIKGLALQRETEITAITRALKNADLRCLPNYRPLCLCSNSKYILNMYARAISAQTSRVHVEMIDVAELSDYDLEPSSNNVFVRSVKDDKDNRFLLFFHGDKPRNKMDAVDNFLQGTMRAKFHLNSPNVTLDLSAVLPICFCDEQNARALSAYCDVVQLSDVSQSELSSAVEDIFTLKEKLYGVSEIKLLDDAVDVFKGYDIDAVERLIDLAVRDRRESGGDVALSNEIMKEYTTIDSKHSIGFGGKTNARYI